MSVPAPTEPRWPPARAGPPPTTVTCFVIDNCWTAPTTTTVGCAPFPGFPSPSVRRFGSSTLSTTAWFVISVPAGVRRLTLRLNCRIAEAPGEIVPAPGPGSGGVRVEELVLVPAASGGPPAAAGAAGPFRGGLPPAWGGVAGGP